MRENGEARRDGEAVMEYVALEAAAMQMLCGWDEFRADKKV